MTSLTRFSGAYLFEGAHLWFGVAVFYYLERGLSLEQTMSMIAFFSLAMVIFEYPTGVIADMWGHRRSLVVGLAMVSGSFFFTCFSLSYPVYALGMIVGAFGSALASGSNIALLHGLSSNFRRDYAHVRSLRLLVSAGALFLGGLLYHVHIALPYFLTAANVMIAALLYATIPMEKIESQKNRFFSTMKESVRYIYGNHVVKIILLCGGVFLMMRISYKWVGPSIFSLHSMDPTTFSTALAVGTLLMGACSKWAGTRFAPPLHIVIILMSLGTAMFAFGSVASVLVCGVILSHGLHGNIDVAMKHAINQEVGDHIRASVNSVENLLARILVVGYIPLMGYFLSMPHLTHLYGVFTIGCIIAVSVSTFLVFVHHKKLG